MTRDEAIEYLKNLPQDEPVFVLRGQDAFAPAAIQVWGTMCLSTREEATRAKGDRASLLVTQMQKWQKERKLKVPD